MELLLGATQESPVRNLDPRVRLAWFLGNLGLIVAAPTVVWEAFLLVCLLLVQKASGSAFGRLKPLLIFPAVVGTQLILLMGVLQPEGHVLLQIGPVAVYEGGLMAGLHAVLLLTALTLVFLQFIMWSSPEDLTALAVSLRCPHNAAVLIGLTLRFLPIVERDLRGIMEGRRTRGLDLSHAVPLARGLVSILPALLLRQPVRAGRTAMYMEMKGYRLHNTRTLLHRVEFSSHDWIAVTAVIIWTAALAAGMSWL